MTLSGTVGSLREKQRAVIEAHVPGTKDVEYDEIRVVVAVDDGEVTRTGMVDDLRAKRAAEADARNINGGWRVENDLTVRSTARRTDAEVAEAIRDAFTRDSCVERQEIGVSVNNGLAGLTGTVDSTFERRRRRAGIGIARSSPKDETPRPQAKRRTNGGDVMVRRSRAARRQEAPLDPGMIRLVGQRLRPLRGPDDLDPLMERVGEARFALLGEASHGTAEYYHWRTVLSRRLILEKGFRFIAVEGDWPACDALDRYVRGLDDSSADAREALRAFDRWPTWMWANEEVAELAEWLRIHNRGLPPDRQVGFHGLDVYSLWESLYEVLGYLRRSHPEALDAARQAFRCFQPYGEEAQDYARATARLVPETCEDEVVELLSQVRRKASGPARPGGGDADFRAEQNALVVKNAEAYYRTMVRGGPGSWNVRDRHMAETLERLARHHGSGSRGIVWEHNTHVGDARFTDMAEDGMVNIGQLARERWGEADVVLVGFATHRGSVIAGGEWDAPMERMVVPPAREGSWEDLLHRAASGDGLVLTGGEADPEPLRERRGHRAIGVVYHPEYEHLGNYVPTNLPRRYDALLFLDETHALHPLPVRPDLEEVPETFPSGK